MNARKKSILMFVTSFALLLVAYIPTFMWMYHRWTAHESYYGHGFLIPLISLYIVWSRKDLLKNAKLSNNMAGLLLLVIGLLLHIVCAALKVYFISGFSFVLSLYGLLLFCFGKHIVRSLVFPVLFLLAMVPMPLVLIGALIVKLKLIVAQISTLILNIIGFPSVLDGSTIRMPSSYTVVAAPCSGLRSLISLLTLGLLFTFAMKISYLKKGVLLLLSIPIALGTNILRIIALAVVNDLYGEKVAMGFFHDFTGFMVFALAFTGLWVAGRVLDTNSGVNR